MANLAKIEFSVLDISGKNYMSWALDVELQLEGKNLGDTIKVGNTKSSQDKANAMIFLRHHIHESLKYQYLTIKDPLELWTKLKERYDHHKMMILPKARDEWIHLRLQDFKTISEYNSAMFRISSQLTLCGEKITDAEMLEKTLSTFHASNIVLQQQYREKGYTKINDLISVLLVAEQNNELLMRNHETRPVGTTPFPEANAMSYSESQGRGRGRGHGRGNQRGRGNQHGRDNQYGHNNGRGRGYPRGNNHGVQFKHTNSQQKYHDKAKYEKNKNGTQSSTCHRCGSNNHWARTCRTPKHLVELYQQSIKSKGKGIEANAIFENGSVNIHGGDTNLYDTTHMGGHDFGNNTSFDTSDFLIDANVPNVGGSNDDTNMLDACKFPYI